jgi:branched-chain amino acid transport system substrate-binding protein
MKNILFDMTLAVLLLFPLISAAEIRTALIVPQSGEYKIWGDELANGVKTAIQEINEKGGIQHKRLSLMLIDDPCSENLSVSAAQMLALNNDHKPALVVGPYCSEGFDKVASIYASAQIFQIVPMPLNAHYASQNYKGLIRVSNIKEQRGADFFDFYNRNWAGRRAIVIFDSADSDMVKSAESAVDQFRRHGKSSLIESRTFAKDVDLMAEEIVQARQDVAFLLGKPKKIAKTIRALKRLNPNFSIVTGKYMVGDSLYEYADPYLDQVYFMGMPSFENNPDYAELLVKLRLKGVEPNGLNIYGYAAVKTWADLVRKAGSLKYDKIVKAARNLPNPLWSSARTSNSQGAHYVFYRYQNGEFMQVD